MIAGQSKNVAWKLGKKLFEGLPGRVEGQCTVLAHLDDEVLALSESHADEGEGSEDSRETHLGLI